MRQSNLIWLAVPALLIAPIVHAEPVDLAFTMPAQIGGEVGSNPEWAFWFFEPDSFANITIEAAAGTFTVVSYPLVDIRAKGTETTAGDEKGKLEQEASPAEQVTWTLRAGLREGGSFLFARASPIIVQTAATTANLLPVNGDAGLLAPRYSTKAFPFWTRPVGESDIGVSIIEAASLDSVTTQAQGKMELVWSGMVVDCGPANGYCPGGGGRESAGSTLPVDSRAAIGKIDYVNWQGHGRIVSGQGKFGMAFMGAERLDLSVNGWSRLPRASVADCEACVLDGQGTLKIEGQFMMARLGTQDHKTVQGELAASAVDVRVDEEKIDPAEIGLVGLAGAGAVTATALVILKFLLAPFFTRLTKGQALEHPRRKQIFEYIHLHPGANFREVARNTNIAAGTVRHHLNVLERSGQVVEHSHGSTVRLFENHGKFDHNWSDMVLLREPALGKLHDWLKAHPNSPQKVVLEAMEAETWSRSTTQHRLSRLVDGGVASIRLQGRLKMYSIVERPSAAKPIGLPPPASGIPA